jgi:PIN domain nuclease of toxin-antitoxin system
LIQLLDTHALLWFLQGADEALPVREVIAQGDNRLSVVSLWEAAIKVSLGRLALPYEVAALPGLCESNGIGLVGVEPEDAVRVAALPFHHRDPFDRLLVATCLERRWPIVSRDAVFDAYGVRRIWGQT